MKKSLILRSCVAAIVFFAAVFYLIPSLAPELPDFWKKYLPVEKIPLGLDLQGGTHLVLEVDTDKAVELTVQRMAENLKDSLMENRVRFRWQEKAANPQTIALEFPDVSSRTACEKVVRDNFPDLEIASTETREGRELMILKMKDKRAEELKRHAVEQSVETIRNRVDQFGVTEPEIIPEGKNRIVVQLPGIKDTARAKNLIGKTALLEFKLVDEEHSLEEALRGKVPEGSYIAYESRLDRESGRRTSVPILLKNRAVLTGSAIESAKVAISDRFGEPYVSIKFNAQGRRNSRGLRPKM